MSKFYLEGENQEIIRFRTDGRYSYVDLVECDDPYCGCGNCLLVFLSKEEYYDKSDSGIPLEADIDNRYIQKVGSGLTKQQKEKLIVLKPQLEKLEEKDWELLKKKYRSQKEAYINNFKIDELEYEYEFSEAHLLDEKLMINYQSIFPLCELFKIKKEETEYEIVERYCKSMECGCTKINIHIFKDKGYIADFSYDYKKDELSTIAYDWVIEQLKEEYTGLKYLLEIRHMHVRESMVLLKNNGGVLPLDATKTIMVIGDGADKISKACGGWTLSWQGTGHTNDEFPNSQTILEGIKEAVKTAGGKVIFSPNGDSNEAADVVIAIYGEDPYAEFQGDLENIDFVPNGFDTNKLTKFRSKDIPVVSVFLSGRPMWTNPEINKSDAFVAAWLPGSEGGGVSDLLFQRDPSYDFSGRLSFAWPSSAVAPSDLAAQGSATLFDLGYGLTYESDAIVDQLSEDAGLENMKVVSTGNFFNKGASIAPWNLWLNTGDLNKQIGSFPASVGGLLVSKTDHLAQEDALRINWTLSDYDQLSVSTASPSDMSRQANGAMELTFSAKSFKGNDAIVKIGMCSEGAACDQTLDINIVANEWQEYRISLSCFANLGVDMSKVGTALMVTAGEGVDIGLSNIRLESDIDAKPGCDGK